MQSVKRPGGDGGGKSKIATRGMVGNEKRELRRSKDVEGCEGQDKDFVHHTGVHWSPVEGHKERYQLAFSCMKHYANFIERVISYP